MTCPECEQEIEDGQEKTIVKGVEWHKWCYQKSKGDKGPVVREIKLQTCAECEEKIEDGQEKTVSDYIFVCACVDLTH